MTRRAARVTQDGEGAPRAQLHHGCIVSRVGEDGRERKVVMYQAHHGHFRAVNIPDTIYIMRCSDYVKIGVSHNPQQRLASIKTMTPFDVEIVMTFNGDRKLEQSLHLRFREYLHRNEWFRFDGALREWIESGCEVE